MTNVKWAALVFSMALSISGLYAQAFNPVNGMAYPVEFTEWTVKGEDKLRTMQSQLRSCVITFNPDTAVMSFGGALFKAAYTFFPGGVCEVAVKTMFLQKTISGAGWIERLGRDFTISLSVRGEAGGDDIITTAKGIIKEQRSVN